MVDHSIRDVEQALTELGWSYVRARDGSHVFTEFTDHLAPVRMVISVENNVLIIRTLGVQVVTQDEMGEVLKLAKDLNVAPGGLMWSRDPEDDQAWCSYLLGLGLDRSDQTRHRPAFIYGDPGSEYLQVLHHRSGGVRQFLGGDVINRPRLQPSGETESTLTCNKEHRSLQNAGTEPPFAACD